MPELFTDARLNGNRVPELTVPLGADFGCICGEMINLGDGWVAAHWTVPIIVTCPQCKQQFSALAGKVQLRSYKKRKG